MLAKGQITVSNLDDGKTSFLHQAYKMKDGRFLKHYPVYEASPVSGYKEGDLWHRTDGSQPGYFVANKSNTTLNLNDWTFYANELAYSDTDKFYPKFEGTYSDYNEVASDDQTKYTWKIIKADDGIGIKSVTEYYLATSEPSGIKDTDKRFTTAIQTMTATNKYLWNYEKINFSNNTSQPTIPVIIGVYGDKGNTGGTGATGRSITAIQEYYLATSASKDITRPNTDGTNGWTTTMQMTTPTNKYLWNYEKITWSSGTTTTYVQPIIIGVHGEKGDKGEDGADAKLLYLSTSAEAMTFNSDNTPNPATQTITFTANMQNTTGTATFTAIPYNGATAMSAITLGGTGNTRTLTQKQFPSTATRIEIKAVLGSLSDTVSVVKLKNGATGGIGPKGATGGTGAKGDTGSKGADGKNAIVGYLTNENITFPANSSGVVTSEKLAMANGVFKVFDGLTEKTGTGVTYSVVTQTGATGAITTAGAYSVSAISADNASITFRAIYSSATIDKVLTLSKSKEGVKGDKGDNAPLVKLSGATQIITQSSTGARTPSEKFTVVGTSVNTTISAWTYSVNGGTFGTGLPTGVTRSGSTVTVAPGSITFNTLSIKATGGGVSDTFTIARIVDGEKGAKGETGSTGGTGSAGKNGADAITVLLSNESHTFQAGTTNAVAGSTTTDIHAYKGTNKVAVTVGTITGMPTGMTGRIINNGKVNARITFTVATKMTSPSGTVIINLTVDNKPIVKEFSYALTFKGQNAVVGLLTNESITLPANKDGLVSNFTGATGIFDVYDGITKKTDTGTVYSVVGQPTNITVDIHATTGVYKVTAMPTGTTILNGYATLKATYNGVAIEKQLNVAKSLTGATGATGAKGPQGATGSRGPVGATGTSVSSVTEYYLATSEPSGIKDTDKRFTTAIQTMTATNKYLWNYEKINFSNNTSQPTIPVIIGVYGDKGQPGSTGATGRSIVSITEHYLATSASSGVTRRTDGWKTSMQPTTETNKYLWNYETINWSSGTTPTYVEPIIIGVHGAKGPQGATGASGKDGVAGKDGKGITSTTITYGLSTTDTVEPTKYTSNVPTLVKGQYLWTRTIWTYTDNTTETGYSVSYIAKDGNDGEDGIPGKTGVGISSTKIEYVGSTSGTTKPTSGWNTAVPTVAPGNYLWTKTTWTYTDNTTEPGYSVARMGSNGAPGAKGGKGATGATGASATSYWITASNNIIGKSQTGVINPTTITFKGFSKTGTATPVDYSGRFIIQTSTNGTTYTTRYTTPSNTNEDTKTYTIPANTLFIKCLFYMAGGTTVLLDEQTVPIVESAEGLEIGNVNLLQSSMLPSSSWTTKEHTSSVWASQYVSNSSLMKMLEPGKEYTFSFDAELVKKGTAPTSYSTQVGFLIYSNTGKPSVSFYTDSPLLAVGNKASVSKTFVCPQLDSSYNILLYTARQTTNGVAPFTFDTVKFSNLMMNNGNKKLPYIPAPEDARTYKAWANSSDGTSDFTRVYPNENLISKVDIIENSYTNATGAVLPLANTFTTEKIEVISGVEYTLKNHSTIANKGIRIIEYNSSGAMTKYDNVFSGVGTVKLALTTTHVRVNVDTLDGTYSNDAKLERGTTPTVYTTNTADSLSGSVMQYIGLSPLNSDNPSEYEWIVNPEYTKALADEALAGKVDNDAEYENLKNMAQEVKESYENFVSEGGEYKTEHSKLLDRTTIIETDLGEYREQINFVDTYMSAGNEGLIIGVKDSEGNPDANAMQMLLSNKSLSFMDGGEVVAYFSGQSFHINRGAIVESLQVGQHKITNLGNGHTVFQYTG